MLRLTEAEYQKMLGSSQNKKQTHSKPAKRNIKSVVTQSIENIKTAHISSKWEPEKRFYVEWNGATVLTLNELLRIDYRSLTGYRNAWKKACYDAVISTGVICKLNRPMVLKLYRRSGRLIDNDAMSAAFKFAIDGMRHAHLIPEDKPEIITDIEISQDIGTPMLRMTFEVLN